MAIMVKSSNSKPRLPGALFSAIETELSQQPGGIKEYDLIQALQGHGYFESSAKSPMPPHDLFHIHFMLFHALYLLRDRLLQEKQSWLEISPLKIQLHPYLEGKEALTTGDKLRAYYLDLNHIDNTTEDDVCELIASFWNKLSKCDKRDDALQTLGLKDPIDDITIKQAYRRLAMEHHPDRGGDKERLQAINTAINILLD